MVSNETPWRNPITASGCGAGGLLAVGLTESSVLGKVRYFAKKTLPELIRAL